MYLTHESTSYKIPHSALSSTCFLTPHSPQAVTLSTIVGAVLTGGLLSDLSLIQFSNNNNEEHLSAPLLNERKALTSTFKIQAH